MRIKDYAVEKFNLDNGEFTQEHSFGSFEFNKGNPVKKITKPFEKAVKKIKKETKRAYGDIEDVATGKDTNKEAAAKREIARLQAAAEAAAALNSSGSLEEQGVDDFDEKKKKRTKTKKKGLKVPLTNTKSTGLKV